MSLASGARGMLGRVQPVPPQLGTGDPLPPSVRHQMETALGHDFSAVRVHQGHEATIVGAQAFTQGDHVHFAPGTYDPHSASGREILGHELAHVVQQRQGRVGLANGLVQL